MKLLYYALKEWRKYLERANVREFVSLEFVCDKNVFSNCFHKDFNAKYDDAFKVKIKNGSGKIIASNERSCLLAVYETLRRIGFIFFNPEKEYIPQKISQKDINFDYSFIADSRYRGVAPCAPKEIKTFKQYIKWLPKVGFNTIFFEGWSGYLAYRSWYLHEENPYLDKEQFEIETAKKYDKQCINLAKSLGLIVQTMGHGFNVATITDNVYNDMFPDKEQKIFYDYIALVNGKKEIPRNILRCTNLCLSNQDVKEKLVKLVIDYAKNNKQVDIIHFWLADGVNTTCECEECLKTTFSDQYVEILNNIDEELSKQNLNVRIAFLLYNDTLFAPLKNKILNQDRFIMLFCPISRDYGKTFLGVKQLKGKEYIRNRNDCPVSQGEFLYRLNKWKDIFKGEIVAFDYHLYYASRFDISGEYVSNLIYNDIKAYKNLNIRGIIQCAFYRNFFPHGFSYYTSALALMYKNFNYKVEKENYFIKYFGNNFFKISNYLKKVCECLPLTTIEWFSEIEEYRKYLTKPEIDKSKLKEIIDITNNSYYSNNIYDRKLNKIIKIFLSTVKKFAQILIEKVENVSIEQMLKDIKDIQNILWENEKLLLPYLSVDHLLQTLYWIIYD